jgi:hypothetical protein
MLKWFAGLAVIIAPTELCHGRDSPAKLKQVQSVGRSATRHTFPRARTDFTGSQVATWFDLRSPFIVPRANIPRIVLQPFPSSSEQIVVYGHKTSRDADWRADIEAGSPTYEANNSDAAQWLVPFREWSTPTEERLMSIKSEWLGICGALGGYITCPNKPP